MTRMISFITEKLIPISEDLFNLDDDLGKRMKIAASPIQAHEIRKMVDQRKGLRILVGAGNLHDFMAVWIGDGDSGIGATHDSVADQLGMKLYDRHVPLELTSSGKMQVTTTAQMIFDNPRQIEDILDRNKEYQTFFGDMRVDYRKLQEAEEFQPEPIEIGDEILAGKFKNSKRIVKGFKTDPHGQPVLKTDRGDTQLYKPRIAKLDK